MSVAEIKLTVTDAQSLAGTRKKAHWIYLESCTFRAIFTRAAPNFETLPSRVDIKCLGFFKLASSLLESLANVQSSRCENIPGNCEFTANDSIFQTLSKVHV